MPPAEQLFAENQALQGTVASLQEKVVSLETQVEVDPVRWTADRGN
jgi:hypothetical protein